MNRTFSTVAVLAMAFLAVAVCVAQTLAAREALGSQATTILLAVEAVAGVAVTGACVALVRRRYVRTKNVTSSKHLEVAGLLRRLLSAVWSLQSHR